MYKRFPNSIITLGRIGSLDVVINAYISCFLPGVSGG